MDAKGLRQQADNTFEKRKGLLILWQEQAENFYPQRAEFTVKRYLGDEFAANLTTSFPLLCHRELSGSFATMLRPTQKEWFEATLAYDQIPDHDGKAWLQMATTVQRRAMYDIHSQFQRAMPEGDGDFACFGQNVTSVRLNMRRDTLIYQTWHLKDCSWLEDDEGKVCPFFRKWRPQARVLKAKFGDRNSPELQKLVDKAPFDEIECLHMIVDMDMYDGDFKLSKNTAARADQQETNQKHFNRTGRNRPYVSVFYDCMHNHLLEAVPVWTKEYAISRWQTVSGSQYAYSPATIAALPDARLLQAMTYTLLEAGEKATNPPMVATEGAVRSDVAIYAGGITWVDYDYDERTGEALRPMTIDKSGLPIGIDMQRDCRSLLRAAFFIDKIKPFLPTEDKEMTAYQAGQIVSQYIRDALPIFEPMEGERNGQICELTFDLLHRNGAFGSPFDTPRSILGRDIQFRFQSPLHDAIEAQKGQKFMEMKGLIAEAMAMDKNAAAVPNVVDALRDALEGIRVPIRWTRSKSDVDKMTAEIAEKERIQATLATMQQGADAAKTGGEAMVAMNEAQAMPAAA